MTEAEQAVANSIAADAYLQANEDGTYTCLSGGVPYLVEIKVFDVSGA